MSEKNIESRSEQDNDILPFESSQKVFKLGPDRNVLGFSIHHDQELHAQHILNENQQTTENSGIFEMWISDEIRELMENKGYGIVKKLISRDLSKVLLDPYGTMSIDPLKHDEEAQEQRTVNRSSDELEEAIGLAVCIKGTGREMTIPNSNREDLISQYQYMRRLSLQNDRLREITIDRLGYCPIKFLDVYGAINYPNSQQFLLMERIVNARHVDQDQKKVIDYMFRFDDPESFDPRTGFFAADHPRLAAYVGSNAEYIGWNSLQSRLKKDGFEELPDLQTRNMLYTTAEDGTRHYVIIDQVPQIRKN